MTDLRFTKMHGAGNDYIYISGFDQKLPEDLENLAIALSHRRFGIGADGIILILPSAHADADAYVQRGWDRIGNVRQRPTLCG